MWNYKCVHFSVVVQVYTCIIFFTILAYKKLFMYLDNARINRNLGRKGSSLDNLEMIKTSFLLICLHSINVSTKMCNADTGTSITFHLDVLVTSLFYLYHTCTSVMHFSILFFSSTMLPLLQ